MQRHCHIDFSVKSSIMVTKHGLVSYVVDIYVSGSNDPTFYCEISSINSSPPSVAYMRQWIELATVQVMACRLFGAKPLSKPVLGYCQFDSSEQTSMKFNQNTKTNHSRKCIWQYPLRNEGHFVQGRWVKLEYWDQQYNSDNKNDFFTTYYMSVRTLATHCSEIWIKVQNISFKKMHWKMFPAKRCILCTGLNMSGEYPVVLIVLQGSFWVWAHPIRDNVTI